MEKNVFIKRKNFRPVR